MGFRMSRPVRVVFVGVALLVLLPSLAFLDTIVTSIQATQTCRGQPSLSNDLEFIRRVQTQYQSRPRIFTALAPREPLTAISFRGEKGRCYKGSGNEKSRWCIWPDEQLSWLGAKLVSFDESPGVPGMTVECRVLRCGAFLITLVHQPCLTMGFAD